MKTGRDNRCGLSRFTHWKLLTVLTALCFFPSPMAKGQIRQIKRVLILNQSDPLSSPPARLLDDAIYEGLKKSPYQIEIHSQVIEPAFFPDKASQHDLVAWITRKYRGFEPHVIIAVGPTPLMLAVDWDKEFFPGTPVVFCGGIEGMAGPQKLSPRFTGVWGKVEPAKTLEAALKLLPRTRRVVVVGGKGAYDRHVEAVARESFRSYESRLDIAYLTDLPMPMLLDRVAHLPPHTIVYHAPITQDAAGASFIDSNQSAPMLAAAANAPVFSVHDAEMGQGTVGGFVFSFALQGQIASEIASKVLNGARPEEIPIQIVPSISTFDWKALRRWGMNEDDVPPGTILLNHEPDIWEAYKWQILGGSLLFMLEGLLIIGLLWERGKRREYEQSLRERLDFETLRSELSASFINLPENQIPAIMQRSLGRMTKALKMDRGTLYELCGGRGYMTRDSSWSRAGFPAAPEIVEPEQFPWFTGRVLSGEVILISNFQPDDSCSEPAHHLMQGHFSAATIPLAAGGEIIGFISLVGTNPLPHWSNEKVKHLNVLAEIFSNALNRIRMQAALRDGEERFRLMANNAPVIIWVAGSDKKCTFINSYWTQFTGKTLDSALGYGWVDAVHVEDRPTCKDAYEKAFEQRATFSMEYRLRRYDGEYRWIVDTGVPRFGPDGSFAGFIGSGFDITERKKAMETLANVSRRLIEAQEKERRHVARELHDDLGQRMALLAIDLQKLDDSLPESLQVLHTQTGRITEHVMEISSEMQTLSHRLHSSKLEFLGIVAAVKSFCSELAGKRNMRIRFEHGNVPHRIPEQTSLCLFRVVQEALQNAVKHSGAHEIVVDLRGVEGAILLSVRDSGTGFDVDKAMHNHGMGLISMRERVLLVRGTISIVSKSEVGTEISVRIPVFKHGVESNTQEATR